MTTFQRVSTATAFQRVGAGRVRLDSVKGSPAYIYSVYLLFTRQRVLFVCFFFFFCNTTSNHFVYLTLNAQTVTSSIFNRSLVKWMRGIASDGCSLTCKMSPGYHINPSTVLSQLIDLCHRTSDNIVLQSSFSQNTSKECDSISHMKPFFFFFYYKHTLKPVVVACFGSRYGRRFKHFEHEFNI